MISFINILLITIFVKNIVAQRSTTVQSKFTITKHLTKYSMSFPFDSKILADELYCNRNSYKNTTEMKIHRSIVRCANENYLPRSLTSSQVSWKKSKNITADGDITKVQPAKNREVVHKYLAFTLLLPRHPYSYELYNYLSIVGPMFPQITIVVGNGYEFQDLCNQYGVRSFPKMLLFKNGILSAKYSRDRNPETLAASFSKWTGQLPKALPISKNLQITPKNVKLFTPLNIDFHFMNRSYGSLNLSLPHPGHSVEPLVGCFENAVDWEQIIFVLSGLYVLSRFFYVSYTYKKLFS